jgi:hypothetical protein
MQIEYFIAASHEWTFSIDPECGTSIGAGANELHEQHQLTVVGAAAN